MPMDKEPINIMLLGHKGHGKAALSAALATMAGGEAVPKGDIPRRYAGYNGRDYALLCLGDHESALRLLLAGQEQVDAVVAVVAANERVTPQTEQQLLAAHRSGIPLVGVYISKLDLDEDGEGADMIERRLRYFFDESYIPRNTPVLRGSVLADDDGYDESIGQLWQLLAAVPAPPAEEDQPFLMMVDTVTTSGPLAMQGLVLQGQAYTGDTLEALMPARIPHTFIVSGLEIDGCEEELVCSGMRATLLPDRGTHFDYIPGQMLATPKSLTLQRRVAAYIFLEQESQGIVEQGKLQLCLALNLVLGMPFAADIVQYKALGSGALCIEAELLLPVSQPLRYGSRFVVWQDGRPAGFGVCFDFAD
ncbi:MAG: hypothetical protein IJO80_00110 [Firmicutes bacterium]|nr:hypothetical protein [Bacillota bacterium]MBQ6841603.1 hypothetical protein [Bacillota bacterium]